MTSADLLELAADEVARLDVSCLLTVPAVTAACWLRSVADAAPAGDHAFPALVAAAADPYHDAALGAATIALRTFIAAEERRARGGAPFALSRWESVAPSVATYPNRSRLEAAWRATADGRSVLQRALDGAAWLDHATSSDEDSGLPAVGVALLFCATGRTARIRFLPMHGIDPDVRRSGTAAWRDGDTEAWATVALSQVAAAARRRREAVQRIAARRERDAMALGTLGRGGINARRLVTHLESVFATTMPTVADALGLSRPAANAALDRLAEAGVVREVTGRARDRVFAWAAPLDELGPA